MRVALILILVLLTHILATPAPLSAWESYAGRTLTVYVRQVEKGNLLVVNESKRSRTGDMVIRFYGIGIPTARQPFGLQAHEALASILPAGTKIIITTVNEDRNGIINALVQLADHSINNRLIDEGLAWVDRSSCKAFFCRRWHIQEHLALKEKRGIWSVNVSTPPWQWGE